MTITDEQLERWQKLCNEATPGEWMALSGGGYVSIRPVDDRDNEIVTRQLGSIFDSSGNNYKFIAESRTAMPLLLAEVKRLRRDVEIIEASEKSYIKQLAEAYPIIKKQEDEVKRLREALRFYADEKTYQAKVDIIEDVETDIESWTHISTTHPAIEKDKGKKAREALTNE